MTRPALLTILAFILAAAACGPAAAAPRQAATVDIKVFQFGPGLLEVTRGTRVEWKNQDAILHTATAGKAIRKDDFGNYDRKPSGAFDLKLDGAGSSGAHTFSDAGEYEYFCDRHPSMTAKVVVPLDAPAAGQPNDHKTWEASTDAWNHARPTSPTRSADTRSGQRRGGLRRPGHRLAKHGTPER